MNLIVSKGTTIFFIISLQIINFVSNRLVFTLFSSALLQVESPAESIISFKANISV